MQHSSPSYNQLTKFKQIQTLMLVSIILILLLTVGCDCYVFFGFLKSFPLWVKILWWCPTTVLLISMLLSTRGFSVPLFTILIILFICVIIPKLLFCLISLLGKLGGLAYGPFSGWMNIAALVISVIFCLGAIYGCTLGWRNLVVKNVDVVSEDVPQGFEGYRIVQLSDLHLGTFRDHPGYIEKMVDHVNSLNPNLIAFTGDLVNFISTETDQFKDALSRLKATDGVVSVLGNHDYALYGGGTPELAEASVQRMIKCERSFGWDLLLDQNKPITHNGDTIWVVGVQNIGRHFSANRGNLEKAMEGVPEGAFTILLSHDPTHWEDAVMGKQPIQLTLSGHTHAMQFKLFGWSPSSWIFKRWGGYYKVGNQTLYVSVGTGGNMLFRFGAWPEITLLTLKK